MVYRISYTGAQGTGKSTLTRALAARLGGTGVTDVQTIAGAGDEISRSGFVVGSHADAEAVRAFGQLHRVREATTSGSVLIFDRCLLDTLAYAQVLDCLPPSEYEALLAATVESSRRQAQLIWLRVTHDYPVCHPQDETPEFRRAIDASIGRLALENRIPLYEYAIPPQSTEEVIEDVVKRGGDQLCPG